MKKIIIGVKDYGMGNHASVVNSLRNIGFRVMVTKKPKELDSVDLMILPGVGAFALAMRLLYERGLVEYLQLQVHKQRPLVGICLGMQLLTSGSHEHEYTEGLNFIPGEVIPFKNDSSHIGWNTHKFIREDAILNGSGENELYYNHSFYYEGPEEYKISVVDHDPTFPSIIRHGKVVGLQFHPEKSQDMGKVLLKKLLLGLINA